MFDGEKCESNPAINNTITYFIKCVPTMDYGKIEFINPKNAKYNDCTINIEAQSNAGINYLINNSLSYCWLVCIIPFFRN